MLTFFVGYFIIVTASTVIVSAASAYCMEGAQKWGILTTDIISKWKNYFKELSRRYLKGVKCNEDITGKEKFENVETVVKSINDL